MRECHRCETSREIAEGKHAGTPFEELPCATCPANDLDHRNRLATSKALRGRAGQIRLAINHDTTELIEAHKKLAATPAPEPEQEPAPGDLEPDPEPTEENLARFAKPLAQLVNSLVALDDQTLLLVLYRLRGGQCIASKAQELRISEATAHAKVASAIEFYPWVGAAISLRKWKGQEVEHEERKQLDMFDAGTKGEV